MLKTKHSLLRALSSLSLGFSLVFTGCLQPPEEGDSSEYPPGQEFLDGMAQQDAALTAPITLPIEVLGAEGFTRSVLVSLTSADVQQPLTLWLQAHGLSYATKASVRFNSGAWLPLNNDTVTVEGLAKAFGGIGGTFSTVKLRLNVPTGALVAGTNQISFRFNVSDGRSIGYRVLKLNLLRADGSRVLPDSTFTQDSPATWQPPLSDAASIAEGDKLWRTRQLVRSVEDPVAIRARCMDCHAQDGRDLKYFNYSNHSIIERSKFHGLTELEGRKIASYIRTLPNVPNPGRPWNPPYQPGPGLDSKPVDQWAAGAGVDAVLEKDRDLLRYMFPNGIQKAAIATTGNLSVREMPIYFQLPDWNHWLPSIHPKDAWGDTFVNNRLNKLYAGEGTATGVTGNMRELSARVRAEGYTSYRSLLFNTHRIWNLALYEFFQPRDPNAPASAQIEHSRKVYSTSLWQVVKMWEVMQEFGLEGRQRLLFPSSRDTRGWMSNSTFDTSPNLLKLPQNQTGILDNSPLTFHYFNMAWYHLAMVLFNGNHSDGADRNGQRPIDWGYAHGSIMMMERIGSSRVPNNALLALWLVKGMQVSDNTLKPNAPSSTGWAPRYTGDLSRLVAPSYMWGWADITPDEQRAIMEALLSTWWDKTRQYPVSDWLNGGGASRTEAITGHVDGSLGNRIWYMLPHFKYHGVNPTLINEIADWAQTIWTQVDWSKVKNANCWPYQHYVLCSSEAL
jgi:hypothetical protein